MVHALESKVLNDDEGDNVPAQNVWAAGFGFHVVTTAEGADLAEGALSDDSDPF